MEYAGNAPEAIDGIHYAPSRVQPQVLSTDRAFILDTDRKCLLSKQTLHGMTLRHLAEDTASRIFRLFRGYTPASSVQCGKNRYSVEYSLDSFVCLVSSSSSSFVSSRLLLHSLLHSHPLPVRAASVISLNPLKMHRHPTGSTGDDRYRMG